MLLVNINKFNINPHFSSRQSAVIIDNIDNDNRKTKQVTTIVVLYLTFFKRFLRGRRYQSLPLAVNTYQFPKRQKLRNSAFRFRLVKLVAGRGSSKLFRINLSFSLIKILSRVKIYCSIVFYVFLMTAWLIIYSCVN